MNMAPKESKAQEIICHAFVGGKGFNFTIFELSRNSKKDVQTIRITDITDLRLIRDAADSVIKKHIKKCEEILSRPDVPQNRPIAAWRPYTPGDKTSPGALLSSQKIKGVTKRLSSKKARKYSYKYLINGRVPKTAAQIAAKHLDMEWAGETVIHATYDRRSGYLVTDRFIAGVTRRLMAHEPMIKGFENMVENVSSDLYEQLREMDSCPEPARARRIADLMGLQWVDRACTVDERI